MSLVTAVVDAHVHIHPCYEADDLFDHAHRNLSSFRPRGAHNGPGNGSQANTGGSPANAGGQGNAGGEALFLLMTECEQDDCFGELRRLASGRAATRMRLRRWSIAPTDEDVSVVAHNGDRQLNIIAGSQVACREGLEVLILGTRHRFRDGLPIRQVLTETDLLGVPRVIPWGPGKWFFQRGRLLSSLLREFHKPTLFLGDEGGRPGFWGYPARFAEAAGYGVRDLPGTDPLPFPHDVSKVGRMGFRVTIDLDAMHPAASLFRALADPSVTLDRFAKLESPLRFVRNQIGMQLRKRRLA